MIASTFAHRASGQQYFPANLPTPPENKEHPLNLFALSMLEILQAIITTQAAAMSAATLASWNTATTSRSITSTFDVPVFASYFEPIPGALKALSSAGLKPIIEAKLHEASNTNVDFFHGVYMDVEDDKSFTLYLSDSNGKGVAAQFERCENLLSFYVLKAINKSAAFGELEESLDFETHEELEAHFQTIISQVKKIIASREPPEPDPPGGGVRFTLAA